jgi:hypothetical protein
MLLPPIQGTLTQNQAFIYTACDTEYFDNFGRALIKSIQLNTNWGLHLHLFNPRPDQLEHCLSNGASVTFENISPEQFIKAAARWSQIPGNEIEKSYYDRTLNAIKKGQDTNLHERMQKTYYACARFVRLAELIGAGFPILSIDVDALVRSNPQPLPEEHDFYLHKITGRKARILAGGMYLHPTVGTQQFLHEYAEVLQNKFSEDYVYWGLDQDVLDAIVPKYNHGQLPISYIDWDMRPTSCIWTAKGTRKNDVIFISEKQKYIV